MRMKGNRYEVNAYLDKKDWDDFEKYRKNYSDVRGREVGMSEVARSLLQESLSRNAMEVLSGK